MADKVDDYFPDPEKAHDNVAGHFLLPQILPGNVSTNFPARPQAYDTAKIVSATTACPSPNNPASLEAENHTFFFLPCVNIGR